MAGDILFYQFSRSKAERSEFAHFLGRHTPDRLPGGRRLREWSMHRRSESSVGASVESNHTGFLNSQ